MPPNTEANTGKAERPQQRAHNLALNTRRAMLPHMLSARCLPIVSAVAAAAACVVQQGGVGMSSASTSSSPPHERRTLCRAFARSVPAAVDPPGKGNHAMVVLEAPGEFSDDSQRQAEATAWGYAETSFIKLMEGEEAASVDAFLTASDFSLRWWTPSVEVPLCGHGTLAAAAALMYGTGNPAHQLRFHTKSGVLTAQRDPKAGPRGVSMLFPSNPPHVPSSPTAIAVYQKIVAAALDGSSAQPRDIVYSPGTNKLIIRLPISTGRAGMLALTPSLDGMMAVDQSSLPATQRVRGVSITCEAPPESGVDFWSRYTTPWNGIPEDAVNGSSHTALGPYYASKLLKTSLIAEQLSPGHGGILFIDVLHGAVRLAGNVEFDDVRAKA